MLAEVYIEMLRMIILYTEANTFSVKTYFKL